MSLQLTETESQKLKSNHTQLEIIQQSDLWEKTYDYMLQERDRIASFFEAITSQHDHVKVILTGAGSSAFIGECIAPYLTKESDHPSFHFYDIPTTNIVSNPTMYLDAKTPTIMVSFARSGNSPESVASIQLGEQLIDDFYQVNITCNHDGYLAKNSGENHTLLLTLPEESNDKGFAMTSSFTCMMLSAMLAFQYEKLENLHGQVTRITELAKKVLSQSKAIKELSLQPFTNIVYLGSGPFLGLAREAGLKMLELTGGRVFSAHESPLGFRHGPKSMLNDDSLIVMMISNDLYTRKYDLDMLNELYMEKKRTAIKIIVVSDDYLSNADDHSDYYFYQKNDEASTDKLDSSWLLFPFILYGQILAYHKSIQSGLQPDNPSVDGSVNRVVKGVTIYPFYCG